MPGPKFEYVPRTYKTVAELALKENEDIRYADINSLFRIDESVHMSTEGSKIVQYFKGKSVFVTGGTGFLGKLLMEKLLRTCKDIENIYMLVRPKKGKSADSRVDETFNDVIFTELEKAHPKFRHKVVPIKGDISLPELGISQGERQILMERVDVIFHVAATVKFDEKIRLATAINVSGTKEIINLSLQCKHLCSLVYVSTAYSNNPHWEIDEIFYEPACSADELIEMVEKKSDKYLQMNKKQILKGWPNTYSFTKAIAENCVKTLGSGLPVCIYRPGIVTSTYREPLRSWIDNLYGPMGAIVGAGTGVLRSFHCDPEKVAEIVPADYVVNGMIAAAYQNQFVKKEEIKIYNNVSSTENPLTWGDFHDLSVFYGMQNPPIKALWYYCNKLNKNYYIHMLSVFLLHFIPAFFMDGYLLLIGKKTRMVNIYKKIHKFSCSLALFSTSEWKYSNKNMQSLWSGLSDIDKKLFGFSLDSSNFSWNSYFRSLGLGVRLYLLKDDMSTIPAAMAKYNKLYYYHKVFQGVCLLVALRIILWILLPIFSFLAI